MNTLIELEQIASIICSVYFLYIVLIKYQKASCRLERIELLILANIFLTIGVSV